jgi:hypothetical protein
MFNAFFAYLAAAAAGDGGAFFAWALALPFFLLFYVRYKAANFFLFILFNIMPFVLCYLLRNSSLLPVFVLFCAVLLIYSLNARYNKRPFKASHFIATAPIAVNFAFAFLNRMFDIGVPDLLYKINAVLALICYITAAHVSNIDESLSVLTLHGSQPVKPIHKFNNRVIFYYVAIVVLIASIAFYIPSDFLLPLLSGIFTGFFRILASIIRFITGLFSRGEQPPAEEAAGEIPNDIMMNQAEPNEFLQLLERIFMYTAYTAAAVLIIAAICYGAYWLYKMFYVPKNNENDIKEFAAPDYKVKNENFIWGKIKGLFPFLDKNARIRRLYYKKVKSYISRGVKLERDNTASVISNKISQYEDIAELTKLYEKARYFEK